MSTPEPPDPAALPTVAVVTLGCARNEVDSEELAGRLAAGGFRLVTDPERAESVLVNTCGFVEAAKKDSVDALLAAADLKGGGVTRRVVAVGCLAERYGAELADALPEADAVLGFDDYESIAERLRGLVAGAPPPRHVPRDRRLLLPIAPVERAGTTSALPGHGALAATRRRLDSGPTAALKLASGCDRRCAFCAIPSFRGRFVSRSPGEVLAEARWLASEGVKELFLVSENTTSYGKDLGEPALLDSLLPTLAGLEGIERVRVSYLQPAELRPALVEAIAGTPGVAAYFDLSFQHASAAVLRRMRRFGDAESFLALLDRIRELVPTAGIRSNLIVGFPGETEADVETLTDFLQAAHLDVTGVFGYSDEDGTEAAAYDDKLDEDEIRSRVERVVSLVDELTAQRAEQRIGERLRLLVEARDGSLVEGRADHQGPDVDGSTTMEAGDHRIGDLVTAEVIGTEGADLVARPIGAAT